MSKIQNSAVGRWVTFAVGVLAVWAAAATVGRGLAEVPLPGVGW